MPSSLFGTNMPNQQTPQLRTQATNNFGFQSPSNLSQIKNMMNMFRSGGDSQKLITNMIQNDPRYKPAFDLIQKHNGDAKAAFYDLAAQKGVDPNAIINMLR